MYKIKFIERDINNYSLNYKLVDYMSVIYENGQVVIPKHIRDRFNLRPGTQVSFRVEGNQIVLKSDYDVLAEFEALCSEGDSSHEETEKLIKKTEERRRRELGRVL
jgi:AbrB family looped-hinge helix DNA binding protein